MQRGHPEVGDGTRIWELENGRVAQIQARNPYPGKKPLGRPTTAERGGAAVGARGEHHGKPPLAPPSGAAGARGWGLLNGKGLTVLVRPLP